MNHLVRPLQDLRSQISDFRFQIERCLVQTDYLSKIRMHLELPLSALSYSVLCNLKSAIRNLQSGGTPGLRDLVTAIH